MAIRILIADDHAVVRDGLRLVLEAHEDLQVVGEAPNGRQAIECLRALAPDVVVMDITMPELNGIEATRAIRNVSPGTRIVILSMHATAEHVFQAFQAGALGYVLKEAAGKEVVDAVRQVHLGRRYLSQRLSETMLDAYVASSAHPGNKSPMDKLSSRERQVLQLVVEGHTSAAIAERMCLSPKTVDTYRSRLMQKLGVGNLASLVKFAVENGLTRPG